MRITGFLLADEDVSAPGPSVETGAIVLGQREVDSLPDEGLPLFYGPNPERCPGLSHGAPLWLGRLGSSHGLSLLGLGRRGS